MRSRFLVLVLLLTTVSASGDEPERFDPARALEISQAAIGTEIADYTLSAAGGRTIRLRSDFAGRPLVVSMVFTTCRNVCPAITRSLETAVAVARTAVGADSFDVVTIGFDTDADTPEAMAAFGRRAGIDDPRWQFLSADEETLRALVADIGFIYFPAGSGYDHINQITVIDGNGRVDTQIYGVGFDPAALRMVLAELIEGTPRVRTGLVGGVVDRVRLFCSVYDPQSGAYRFDSLRLGQLVAGGMFVLAVVFFLLRELFFAWRRRRAPKNAPADARR